MSLKTYLELIVRNANAGYFCYKTGKKFLATKELEKAFVSFNEGWQSYQSIYCLAGLVELFNKQAFFEALEEKQDVMPLAHRFFGNPQSIDRGAPTLAKILATFGVNSNILYIHPFVATFLCMELCLISALCGGIENKPLYYRNALWCFRFIEALSKEESFKQDFINDTYNSQYCDISDQEQLLQYIEQYINRYQNELMQPNPQSYIADDFGKNIQQAASFEQLVSNDFIRFKTIYDEMREEDLDNVEAQRPGFSPF